MMNDPMPLEQIEQALATAHEQLARLDAASDAYTTLQQRVAALERDLLDVALAEPALSDEARQAALDPVALPRWFTPPMLATLLPDHSPEARATLLDEWLAWGEVERARGPVKGSFRVPDRARRQRLEAWESPARRDALVSLSGRLADVCAQQAEATTDPSARRAWRVEQLYHLVAADPDAALDRMQAWVSAAVDERFDLSVAYGWLRPLEERRDLLEAFETERDVPGRWTAPLDEARNYLSARACWTDAWYKSIPYLQLDDLVARLDRFFGVPAATVSGFWLTTRDEDEIWVEPTPGPAAPWLMVLHAPGGYGKTALIEWLLSRYVLPKGYACAHFDYDTLRTGELQAFAARPDGVIERLAASLNAQRADDVGALTSLVEARWDAVQDFALVLYELYPDRTVLLFLDTLEVLLERVADPEAALEQLLVQLRRLRDGEDSIPGNERLRVVLAGRVNLVADYPDVFERALAGTAPPLVLAARGFTRDEARRYLRDKRKLSAASEALVTSILDKATDVRADEQGREIIPLKLAIYADTVQGHETEVEPDDVRATDDVDLFYLVNRILKRIADPDLHWLLRYGVVFRDLDAPAAQVLMPYLEQVRAGDQALDVPDLDDEQVRTALAASRDLADRPLAPMERLLEKLARYSWVSYQPPYLRFHPVVRRPQLAVVAGQPIFRVLHEAAHEHFRARAEAATDPQARADALREAVFHGFYLGEPGLSYWREQRRRYQRGPALVLKAIVDEALTPPAKELPPDPVRRDGLLTDEDRCDAYLAVAHVLCAGHRRPILDTPADQLAVAEETVLAADQLAGDDGWRHLGCTLVHARVTLAQGAPAKARELAALVATTAGRLDSPAARAMALQVEAEVAQAQSDWARAQAALREAYTLAEAAEDAPPLAPFPPIRELQREIGLHLVALLLDGTAWRDALPIIDALREAAPDDPDVLGTAGRVALERARLEEADELFARAIERSASEAERATWRAEQRLVRLYQGRRLDPDPDDPPTVTLLVAAARADWVAMERILLDWRSRARPDEKLDVINLQLQFYVEVAGNWRQARELLARGEREAKARPEGDPARARFEVMRQYLAFLDESIELDPDVAQRECARHVAEVEGLQTPEARVVAKAWLLLVRQYGALDPDAARDEREREALALYRDCATNALQRVLDLLLDLPPFDQVDLLRTLAALPGWSSSLVNRVTLDPAERAPVWLLAGALRAQAEATDLSFYRRLLGDRLGDQLRLVGQYAISLVRSLQQSEATWGRLFESAARLLATLQRRYGSLALFREAASLLDTPRVESALEQYDQLAASLTTTLADAIQALVARLRAEPDSDDLVQEVCLNGAHLALQRGEDEGDTLTWLETVLKEAPPESLRAYHAHLLRLIVYLRREAYDEARESLEQAWQAGQGLGLVADDVLPTTGRDAATALAAHLQAILDSVPALSWETLRPQAEAVVARMVGDPTPKGPLEGATRGVERDPYDDFSDDFYRRYETRDVEAGATRGGERAPGDFVLQLVQQDEAQVRVSLFTGAAYVVGGGLRRLDRVRGLLLEKSARDLPSLYDWHRLLHPELSGGVSYEQIGRALLDDLLPPDSDARGALVDYLGSGEATAVRLQVEGDALELIPWGLLYVPERQAWLSTLLPVTHGRPDAARPYSGPAIAVVSYEGQRDRMRIRKKRDPLYAKVASRDPAQQTPIQMGQVKASKQNVYGGGLLFQAGDALPSSKSVSGGITLGISNVRFPQPPRWVHLLGSFHEMTTEEGVSLAFVDRYFEGRTEPMPCDALAHALRWLGVGRCVIVLEALPSGSLSEDLRVLLLRNRYASALSRLGPWTIVTMGPYQSPRTDQQYNAWLERLLLDPSLTPDALDQWLRDVHREGAAEGQGLASQIALFYPSSSLTSSQAKG